MNTIELTGSIVTEVVELTGSIEATSMIAEVYFSKIKGEVEDNPQLVAKFAKYQPLIEDLDEIRQNAKDAVEGLAKEVERATTVEQEISEKLETEIIERKETDTTLQENIDKEKTNRQLAIKATKDDLNSFKRVFEINKPDELTYTLFHNLSTKDLFVQTYLINGIDLTPEIKRDYDTVTLTFNSIPEDDFRVVILALNEWSVRKLAFDLPMI